MREVKQNWSIKYSHRDKNTFKFSRLADIYLDLLKGQVKEGFVLIDSYEGLGTAASHAGPKPSVEFDDH